MATLAATVGRRVKLYVLTDDGKWDDRGTGSLTCHPDPHNKLFTVRVLAEATGKVLLCSQLRSNAYAHYSRPEQNIISWNERAFPNSNSPTEVALSFADPDGCAELWRRILMVDRLMPPSPSHRAAPQPSQTDAAVPSPAAAESQPSPQSLHAVRVRASPPCETNTVGDGKSDLDARDQYHPPTPPARLPDLSTAVGTHETRLFDDNIPNSSWNRDAFEDVLFHDTPNLMCLPTAPTAVRLSPNATNSLLGVEQLILAMSDPDRDGIMTLVHLLTQSKVMDNQNIRQAFVRLVSSSQFMESVCKTFRETEVRGDVELLGALNFLVRSLFRLSANNVLEVLLSEKYLTDVIGCLEYDEQNLPRFSRALNELKRKRMLREEKNASTTGQQDAENATNMCRVRSDQHDERTRSAPNAPNAPNAKATVIECQSDSPSLNGKSQIVSPSALVSLSDRDVTEASSELLPARVSGDRGVDGVDETAIDGNLRKDRDENMSRAIDGAKPAVRLSSPSKNNDEETTSSGNMGNQDLGKPLVLRRHRDFLERTVLYKSVIPITDASVLAKIHQNYRITYIRDVILSRINDDTTANSLSNLTIFNNVDIIMYFIRGNVALREVFERLNNALDQRRKLRFGSISSNDRNQYCALNDSSGDVDAVQAQSDDVKHDAARGAIYTNGPLQTTNREESVLDERRKGEQSSNATVSANSSRSRATLPASYTNITSSREASTTTRKPCKPNGDDGKKNAYDCGTCDLKSSERSIDTRSELMSTLGFLKELCGIVRGQQLVLKDRFYSLLLELGILDAVLILLEEEDNSLRSLACDILSAVIIHNPGEVRSRILKNVTQQDSSVPRKQSGNDNLNCESTASGVIISEHNTMPQQGNAEIRGSTASSEQDSEERKATNGKRDEAVVVESVTMEVHSKRSDAHETGGNEDREQGAGTSSVMTNDMEKENHGKENESKEIKLRYGPGKANSAGEKREAKSVTLVESKECRKRSRSKWRVETDFPLLSMMMKIICEDSESGLVLCMLDMVRVLVDPITMRVADKGKFLEVFYGKFAPRLLDPIVSTGRWHEVKVDASVVENVGYLCDMLSFCVLNHDYHARYFVIGFDVGAKVCALLLHARAHVRLAAIRFVRTCIGMCEDFYDGYLVRRGLVGCVMDMFARNGGRDNLTQSAILELVSFVTRRGRGLVLREVVEKHGDVLARSAQHSGVYGDARQRWEKLRREGGRWDKVGTERMGGERMGGNGAGAVDCGRGQVMTGMDVVGGSAGGAEGEERRSGRLSMSSSEVRARGAAAVEGAAAAGAWQEDSGERDEDSAGSKRRRVCGRATEGVR